MKEVVDNFLGQVEQPGDYELFCKVLKERIQQIQVDELVSELISVEIQKSDKTLNLKFKLF